MSSLQHHAALPEVLHSSCSTNEAAFRVRVDPELPFFAGHFPGNPVVPGFVLVSWALHFASHQWPECSKGFFCPAVKFHTPVVPEDIIILSLGFDGDRHTLTVRYTRDRDGNLCCSGTVTFQ